MVVKESFLEKLLQELETILEEGKKRFEEARQKEDFDAYEEYRIKERIKQKALPLIGEAFDALPVIRKLDKAISEVDENATYLIEVSALGYEDGEFAQYSWLGYVIGDTPDEYEYDEDTERLDGKYKRDGKFLKDVLKELKDSFLEDFREWIDTCFDAYSIEHADKILSCIEKAIKLYSGETVSSHYKSVYHPYTYCDEKIEFEGDGEKGYCEVTYIHNDPGQMLNFYTCSSESFSYKKLSEAGRE